MLAIVYEYTLVRIDKGQDAANPIFCQVLPSYRYVMRSGVVFQLIAVNKALTVSHRGDQSYWKKALDIESRSTFSCLSGLTASSFSEAVRRRWPCPSWLLFC